MSLTSMQEGIIGYDCKNCLILINLSTVHHKYIQTLNGP
jgi:hypothetical protein